MTARLVFPHARNTGALVSGLSHRLLTTTLRGLEWDGLVARTAFATIPPRANYELTKQVRSLHEPLLTLASWASSQQSLIKAPRKKFDKRLTDKLPTTANRNIELGSQRRKWGREPPVSKAPSLLPFDRPARLPESRHWCATKRPTVRGHLTPRGRRI